MKSSVILGMGFGDEGKGLTTSYLVSKSNNPIVIRFNGGHQAGHTVVHHDIRHVFSHFGSGTLQNAPTFWSRFCTVSPIALLREYHSLVDSGAQPKIYIDAMCPVTTPFDIEYNRQQARETNHGSVGVGFGTTLERHEKYFKLHAIDLKFDSVLKGKMQNIAHYYKTKLLAYTPDFTEEFINAIHELLSIEDIEIVNSDFLATHQSDHFIFEGAQGILLDQDFGFFPNVTRSNTTSKNALQLIREANIPLPEIFYITRSYQTRHGNGYMTNEHIPITLQNHEDETNVMDEYQGTFRTALIDIELLKYAIACDNNFSNQCTKNIVITCTDQYEDETTKQIPSLLETRFKDRLFSTGNSLNYITSEMPHHSLSIQDIEV